MIVPKGNGILEAGSTVLVYDGLRIARIGLDVSTQA